MKRIIPWLFLLFVFFTSPIRAQVGQWMQQQIPAGLPYLSAIDMYDTRFGMAAGVTDVANDYSGIVYTTDGFNWYPISASQFLTPLEPWTVWRAICIVDPLTIFVAGDSALVYYTTDGGFTWDKSRTRTKTPTTLRDILFIDQLNGVAVGGDSYVTVAPGGQTYPPMILRTTDGGMNWTDESPFPGAVNGDPAFRAVKFAYGTWATAGEFATILTATSPPWTKLQYPTANINEIYNGLSYINNNDIVVSGMDDLTKKPRVYITTNGGSRFFNITPKSIPSNVSDLPANYFFNRNLGWVGASPNYLAVTSDGGATWKQFQTGGIMPSTPMARMEFIDSLNGWACGGSETANNSWIIRYFGVPPKPNISTSQSSAVFREITCEPYVDTTIVIRNSGTGDLIINSGNISFDSPDYSTPGIVYPIKITPGKGKTITVRWKPSRTSFGVQVATMSIYSNDPDRNPWKVRLEGKRNYGTIELDKLVDLQSGVCLKDSADFTLYGYNIGNRIPTFIKFEYVSGNNEFALLSPPAGTVINGTRPFVFRFKPTQIGQRKGFYRVISGNPSCPDTLNMEFRGMGDRTRLVSNLTEVDFGKVCINTFRDSSIVLTNVGTTYALVMRREHKSGVDMFPSMHNVPIYLKTDSSKTYQIRFAPTLTGAFTAEYRIISDPCPDTVTIRLKGEGISTEISFNPPGGISVGPTNVGKMISRTVTIRNTGATQARITQVALANTFADLILLNAPSLPKFLAPNESFDVMLRYTPQKLGALETTLNVAWSDVCPDTAKLPVSAPCVPNPVIDPPIAMDIRLQACPKPVRDTLYIRNKGNGPLVFYVSSINGLGKDHFKLISPVVGDTVKAKDSVRLIIEYNRPSEGSSIADLVFSHNDVDRMPTVITLTGRRTVADFTVRGDSVTSFFTRLFVSQSRSYTVKNTSNQPISVSGIDVTKSMSVFAAQSSSPLPKSLQPGDSITFDVIFTPNGRGPFNGVVRVTSQPCGTTSLINLTGSGDTEGLSVDRGNIEFNSNPCAFEPVCDTLKLSNEGKEAVVVQSISITQAVNVFGYSLTDALPFTVAPGQEKKVIICADPTYFGAHTASLDIVSNDPAYPNLKVSLRSTRDSSNISVSVSEIDFGRLAHCASSLTRQVTVMNTGSLPEIVSTGLTTGSPAFSSTGSSDVTLLPGKSFTFTITFHRPAYNAFSDTLEVTYERCPLPKRIPIKGEWVSQQYAAAPSPLVFPSVNIGTTSSRSLVVQNNGGFIAEIEKITVTPANEFTVQSGYPTSITQGNSLNLQIRYKPQNEGASKATICVIFKSPCPDTVCVELEGTGVRGKLTLTQSELIFGILAQCEQRILEDTLHNTGTGPVTLLSANITGPGAVAFTNLTPVSAPETILPGSYRIFRIQYNGGMAPTDGQVDATLSLITDDLIQPLIEIPLEGNRHTLLAAGGATLPLGLLERGRPEQRTIMLQNNGSAQLCYTSAQKPSLITFTPNLPICLNPSETMDLTITFMPDTVGMYKGSLTLYADKPCTDSTVFTIEARIQEGSLAQTSTVDLGGDAYCKPKQFAVQIQNTYLEDITLDSFSFIGPDAAFFSVTSPTTLPQTISSGGSLTVDLRFAGENKDRSYSARLVCVFTLFGQTVTRTTDISASTSAPGLSVTSISFPTVILGQTPTQLSSTITNTSTMPVLVESVISGNPVFRLLSVTPSLPALLQPGEKITAQVEFIPDEAKSYTDSLRVISNDPCPLAVAAVLSGTAVPQQVVQAGLSIGALEGKPDDRILIPILVDKDLGGAEVTSWTGSVSFNKTMLHPIKVVKEGTRSTAMNVAMQYDQRTGTVTLTASGGTVAAGTTPLVFIECLALIGDAEQTTIRFSSDFDFSNGFARVVSRSDGSFKLVGYCLPGQRLVRVEGLNKLYQNNPNPVSQGVSSETRVAYSIATDAFVELTLYDIMGRPVRILDHGVKSAGLHDVNVELGSLPPGVYYYTLKSGDFIESKKLVITR